METGDSARELSFYSERNSVGLEDDAKQLLKEPETTLTSEQQLEVESFAKAVYSGRVGDILRESPRDLEAVTALSPGAFIQEFYLGYFLTEQGREDAAKMGISIESPETIAFDLRDIAKIESSVDSQTRKRIAKKSLDWYKGLIVEELESDRDLDEAQIDDSSVTVNYKPEKLLEKLQELEAHRRFYRQVRASLNQEGASPVRDAKLLELDLNAAQANSLVAALLDNVLDLGRQALEGPSTPESAGILRKIEEFKPLTHRALTRDRGNVEGIVRQSLGDFEQNLARRTDYLINGVAWSEDGRLTSISRELLDFAVQITRENENRHTDTEPVLDSSIIDKLKQTKWNGEQFKAFCEAIIKDWGVLSDHQVGWSEAAERDGMAEDKKWQVVVGPQKDSIAVQRTKKLLVIPESFDRNLIKTLTVAAHELAHLAQAESDTVLAEHIPLAAAGGRRISVTREGGAIDQEAKAYAMLGVNRPTRVGYLAALQAKLDGANIVQVARAFYDNYEDETGLSDEEKRDNRKLAADRALRLYRNGGYNSQPLNYIEGELTKRALSQVSPNLVEIVMIAAASFSLRDLVRLHQAGLYDVPSSAKFHPADDVMRIFRQSYLESLS